MRFSLVLILGCLLTPLARADFLAERRVLWERLLTHENWDMCQAEAVRPQSRIAGMLALKGESFDSYFADLTFGRFDGEEAEFLSFTLLYLDCKLGHRPLMRQLDRQPQQVRSDVAEKLLRDLEYLKARSQVPAYFLDYIERNQSADSGQRHRG